MKRSLVVLAPIIVAAPLLVGFSFPKLDPTDLIPKDATGWIPAGTAIFGGVGCHALFKGKSQTMATALCTAGGALLGIKIRDYLKEREKAQLAEATYRTLDTGQGQSVRTEEGTVIRTEMVKPPGSQPPASDRIQGRNDDKASPERIAAAPADECGTVRQTIVTKDNNTYEDTVKACKKEGSWVAA